MVRRRAAASRRSPRPTRSTIKDTPERIAAAGAADHRRSTRRGRKWSSTSSCSKSIAPSCASTACRSPRPGSPGINGIGRRQPRPASRCQTCRNLTAVRRPALPDLPALYYRLLKTDTNTRTLANPQLRTSEGIAGAGAVRRAGAGAGHDVRADRDRRRHAAADHVVQLPEHRREHRHHAAHAPRRRRVADAEGRGDAASRDTGFGGLPTFGNREINTIDPAAATARPTCWRA